MSLASLLNSGTIILVSFSLSLSTQPQRDIRENLNIGHERRDGTGRDEKYYLGVGTAVFHTRIIDQVGGAGMPSAISNHASMSEFPSQREENTSAIAGKMDNIVRKASNVVTHATNPNTNPNAIGDSTPVAAKGKQPDKHSIDYVMRSGIAGGLAGCVVCIPSHLGTQCAYFPSANNNAMLLPGQNHRRTSRSSQDPLPD